MWKGLKQVLALASVALLTAQVQARETLVLYTSQPNADAQATVDAFEKTHPDIEVQWVRDGTTQLITRLQAEWGAGVAKPDLLLIADSLTLQSLKRQGRLQPYLSPERQGYAPDLYDAEGYYYGTKLITTGIAYHRDAPVKPSRWADLAQAEMRNQVAMPSPLYSGAALIHLATLTARPELGWDYYQRLKANGASAQGGNGGVLSAIAAGTRPYGMLVDFMAIRERAKGAPIEFVFPEEGVSAVTEPVAILKGARHPEAAHRFVDFLLSEEGQRLVLSQGYLPALNGLPVPPGFPPRESIRALPVDTARVLEEADADKARFARLFGAQ